MAEATSRQDIDTLVLKRAALSGLKTALKILPMAQLATVISAVAFCWVFGDVVRPVLLFSWCGLVVAGAFLWIAMSLRDNRSDEIPRENPFLRHMVMAGLSSGLFALLIFWLFPLTEEIKRVFLGVFAFSFQLTGAFGLSTAPPVSLVWIFVLGVATFAMLLTGNIGYEFLLMIALETLYLVYLVYLVFKISHFFRDRFITNEELRIFKRAIEDTPASVVLTDPEGTIRYVNPAFTQITGYGAEEALGRNPRLLKSGLHDEPYYRRMWETLAAGRTWYGEIANKKKDGSLFWELASISPIKDEKGVTAYYVAVKENITARKDMERLKEDVDRIMRPALKQPLTAIVGYPRALAMTASLNEEQLDMVRAIEEAGRRMLRMIELSLDLFRMETGKYVYQPQEVDALAVIAQIIDHNRAKLEAKKQVCRISVNGHEPMPGQAVSVCSEERLLYTLLSNLLVNAMEASPDGEPIAVEITEDAVLRIGIHNRGAVPKAIRNAFFEKYKSFGKAGGTGLGTYSAKLMATAMQYDLTMETSDEQDRTSVFVLIPRPPAAPPTPLTPAA
jgi:PAS domain S-box-containing protein